MSVISSDDTSTVFDDMHLNDVYDDESLTSSVQRALKKIKPSADTGKRYVYRTVYDENERRKTKRIEFYETPAIIGRYIRDAVTGKRCAPFRFGSKEEDLFYSVTLATGENGTRQAPILFFDNPEQYERLFHTQIPQHAKELWLEKRANAYVQFMKSEQKKKTAQ